MKKSRYYLVNFEVPKTFVLIERLVVALSEEQAIEYVSREGKLKCIRELTPLSSQYGLSLKIR